MKDHSFDSSLLLLSLCFRAIFIAAEHHHLKAAVFSERG